MFWLDVMFLRLILIICFYLILGEINELLPPIFWNIQTILFVLIIVIVYFFLLGMIFVILFDVGSSKLAFGGCDGLLFIR